MKNLHFGLSFWQTCPVWEKGISFSFSICCELLKRFCKSGVITSRWIFSQFLCIFMVQTIFETVHYSRWPFRWFVVSVAVSNNSYGKLKSHARLLFIRHSQFIHRKRTSERAKERNHIQHTVCYASVFVCVCV